MRALIVDDALYMRLKLRQILEESDCEVVGEAGNGKEGVIKYFELKPDFVTMDLTMPVMGGLEAMENIVEKDPEAKIVVVSAKGQNNLIYKALQKGACDYVVKPYHNKSIMDIVQKLVKQKE